MSLRMGGVPAQRGQRLVLKPWMRITELTSRRQARRELTRISYGAALLLTAVFTVPMLALIFLRQVALPVQWEPPILFVGMAFGMWPASTWLCWWGYVTWLAFTRDLPAIRARMSGPLDGLLLWHTVAGACLALAIVTTIFAVGTEF